jgi:hypothetical protein
MGFLGQNKKGGRPAFKPTKPMRNRVEIAAAAGVSHNQIASALGIAKQTLETHFASELRDGRTRKLIAVLCLLDKAAKRGSVAAAKYLVNVFFNGAPVRLGKKELQKREAEIALANSEWGDILGRTDMPDRSSTDGPAG